MNTSERSTTSPRSTRAIRQKPRQRALPRLRAHLLGAAVAACFITATAWSLPTGMAVVGGAATASQSGNVLNITNSNGAILEWQKFGISAGELTRFIQSSAASSVLNRVVGSDLSAIYGSLQSNGRVWLVNPAGILVGPGATIDTAAFVASTLAIRNEDFLAGRLTFGTGGGLAAAGNIINQGTITTPTGGAIYLIGANVTNEGIITSPKGEVILATGQTVNLVNTSTPGVKVEITGAAGNTTNLGSITAEAGRVGMAGVIVRNSGTLNASSVVEDGGKVFLRASQDAYVNSNGRIVATGTKGGQIEVLGNRVAVMDNASLDASGANGGGKVLVGGDYQGKNPDVQNAEVTYFGPNAAIKANATKVGAGGTVIVWADDTTRAYGWIEARGGAEGGDGGFVETSGKRYLDVQGIKVGAGATAGNAGTWLLDPSDINIVHDGGVGNPLPAGLFNPGGATGAVTDADINATLNDGTDVVITTASGSGGSGNITIYGSADVGGAVFIENNSYDIRSLTLRADGGIQMNSGATITGGGYSPLNVTMEAYGGTPATGSIALYGGIVTFGGNLTLYSKNGDVYANTQLNTSGSNSSTVTASAGQVSITGRNVDVASILAAGADAGEFPGGAGGNVDIIATGSVSITSGIDLAGGYGYSIADGYGGGNLTINAANTVTIGGSIVTSGGDALGAGYAGGAGGNVRIEAGGASGIQIIGDITTSGGSSGENDSGSAGTVDIIAHAGPVQISGSISALGGETNPGYGTPPQAGNGGAVTIESHGVNGSGAGITVTGVIDTTGGYTGYSSYANGNAGNGGWVALTAYGGGIQTSHIRTGGGYYGWQGGQGGDITLNAGTFIHTGDLWTTGGVGYVCDSCGANGGNGGNITLNAGMDILVNGRIDTLGGYGYTYSDSFGNSGHGGNISLTAGTSLQVIDSINASGGGYWSSDSLYQGGYGGNVTIDAGGAVSLASISAFGYDGLYGGAGGNVTISTPGSVSLNGNINVIGGSGAYGSGSGGLGGNVSISAGTSISGNGSTINTTGGYEGGGYGALGGNITLSVAPGAGNTGTVTDINFNPVDVVFVSSGSAKVVAVSGNLAIGGVYSNGMPIAVEAPYGSILASGAGPHVAAYNMDITLTARDGIGTAETALQVSAGGYYGYQGSLVFSKTGSASPGIVNIAADGPLVVESGNSALGDIWLTSATGGYSSSIVLEADKGNVTASSGSIIYTADAVTVANSGPYGYSIASGSVTIRPYTVRHSAGLVCRQRRERLRRQSHARALAASRRCEHAL